MNNFLQFMGIIFLLFIASIAIELLVLFIEDKIHIFIYRYKYRHRFDKKPIAKCYCKDCIRYLNKDQKCSMSGVYKHFVDSDFCAYAEPMSIEEAKERKKDD